MTKHDNPLWDLTALGQSVWLDFIRRGILESGELERLVRTRAVRGVTSNPAIFELAIAQSSDYDAALDRVVAERRGASAGEVYEDLAIEDIRAAADVLRPVYDESEATDGYVSLEVSPELAHETGATLEEARRLWQRVERPNVMIKVPGTVEGIPAVEELLFEGLNINITLLFSLQSYEAVMDAYLRALERRAEAGLPLANVASVASFFVSRVDTAVDAQLEAMLVRTDDDDRRRSIRSLLGRAAIANAKLAYARFREVFGGERFARLRERGAHVQRPLWASTSTKNPAYRDVVYVEELIGPDTVNTMPLATLEAFANHGLVRRTVDAELDRARADLAKLAELGIDLGQVTEQVQREGVEKFVLPFRSLLQSLDEKLARVAGSV